jgi:hypothetical protein
VPEVLSYVPAQHTTMAAAEAFIIIKPRRRSQSILDME